MPKRKRSRAAKKGWETKRLKKDTCINSCRPIKLKMWDDESMKRAMKAVKGGLMGVNQAARNFKVPRTTLRDRLSGRVEHGAKSGPEPYLTKEEEQELADFLKQASRVGYGKTKKEILVIVQKLIKKKVHSKCERFNLEGWWHRFMSRQKKLSLRTADPLSKARADALTPAKVDEYFKLLLDTLENHDLLDKPFHIYNVDESGMPLEHKQPKRVAEKGAKKVYGRSSGSKAQITIVGCRNASGSIYF